MKKRSDLIDYAKGMLVGLAAGDAVGTTVEFKSRGSFPPVTDMTGGGPFRLEKGQWTDDTSMALCLGASLIETPGFDLKDQIEKYLKWRSQGYMSSTGTLFDIGNTVSSALDRYIATDDPMAGSINPRSAGNGSLMRLAPIALAYHRNRADLLHYAGESSKTTHGCDEAVESCRLFAVQLNMALEGADKTEILTGHGYRSISSAVNAIGEGQYLDKTYEALTGSGYVIESLESALWCFYHASNFKEAILLAVNIGNDADTTAAICGQIAGAYYGVSNIPTDWVQSLTMRDDIEQMSVDLLGLFND